MRVLVLGGNGFIGSSIVERLQSKGCGLRVLDLGPPRAGLDWSGVEYVNASLLDRERLVSALDGVDCVFHLASSTVPSTSNLDPVADVQGNLVGTLGLISAMKEVGVRRMIYFSSGGTVYGNPEGIPVAESHPLRPISSYGVVKVAVETYLTMYAQLGQLDPLILRPSNPYGPRQSSCGLQGAIGTFLRLARDGQPITLWGDGEVLRDYLFIDDLVDLAVDAGLGTETGIVNAGNGVGHTLNELCAVISSVIGRQLEVRHEPGRSFDVRRIVLDNRLAHERFGWKPRTSLRDGIEITWRSLP